MLVKNSGRALIFFLLDPAEFGLACHLGVLSGLPCVGVAKNLLQVQGVHKSEEHQTQVIYLKTWFCPSSHPLFFHLC